MDMNPPSSDDDELDRLMTSAVQQCRVILRRWRAGARFSLAAQHNLCRAALRLHTTLGLRLPARGESNELDDPKP